MSMVKHSIILTGTSLYNFRLLGTKDEFHSSPLILMKNTILKVKVQLVQSLWDGNKGRRILNSPISLFSK